MTTFRFEHMLFIYAIPVVVLLVYLCFYALSKYRSRALDSIGERSLVEQNLSYKSSRYNARKYLTYVIGILLCIAFANPQWGTEQREMKTTSADVYIALDISQSMMAQDVPPSRLSRAKRFAEDLIEKLRGDRISVIFFAGSAFVQMPLTSDYAAAKMAIATATTSHAGTQGTNIADAIKRALESYREGDNTSRALVILTDGEEHDHDALSMAAEARSKDVQVYTIGVGTEKGELVPETVKGIERYKKDKEGKPVISKLNIEMIKDIAKRGGGQAYMIDQGEQAIDDIHNKLLTLQKQGFTKKSFSDYSSYYQYPLFFGFVLIVLQWLWGKWVLKRS